MACLDCSKPVENEERGIKCSLCGLWIHLDCISRIENQPGISPEIYERLSERRYKFHCLRCKSTKGFLQSLYDTKIVSREEAEKWNGCVVFEEQRDPKGELDGSQGDASTTVQSPMRRQSVSQFVSQSPKSLAQKNLDMSESAVH